MPTISSVQFNSFANTGSGFSWSSPSSAQNTDATNATVLTSSDGNTATLLAMNASTGLSGLSNSDIINGITVTIRKNANANTQFNFVQDVNVQLYIAGVASGTNKADTVTQWPDTETSFVYGGPTDTWGLVGLTGADLKASNFGVGVIAALTSAFSSTQASINSILLTVDYTIGIINHPTSDSGTISAAETRVILATLGTSDAGTATANDSVSRISLATPVDSGVISASETSVVLQIIDKITADNVIITGPDQNAGINLSSVDNILLVDSSLASIFSTGTTSDQGTIIANDDAINVALAGIADTGTFVLDDETLYVNLRNIADTGTISTVETSIRRITEIALQQRLRVDIFDKDGVPVGFGPQVNVLSAAYTLALDEIGTFQLSIPASLENTQFYHASHRIQITREGEGPVFAGIIDHPEFTIDANNNQIMNITGDSKARELVWANTLLARAYSNETLTTIVDDLLAGTPWTLDLLDGTDTLTARYDGSSIWDALLNAAQAVGMHLRENNLESTVDVFQAGDASGLIIRNVDSLVPSGLNVIPLLSIKITENETDLWNRIVPLGSGVANNVLTLEHATLFTPYPIQTMVGPDGSTIWYIEDTASQDQYDIRTKILKVDDVTPISNSTAEIENAANTLYKIAAAWLGWHAFQKDTYEVQVTGLKHYDMSGDPLFRLGQTVRLQYRGIVENERGMYVWKDVDSDLYIMKAQRTFQGDGSDQWSLTLSTVDQFGDDNPITKAIDDIWALRTALKPYTYMEQRGPVRLTADSSHNFEMNVEFDDNVTYIHRSILSCIKRTIRSNVQGAAGGGSHSHTIGGSTSNSGGGGTSSAGGATTSSGGSSHSHAIGATTTGSSGGAGRINIGTTQSVSAWVTPAYMQNLVLLDYMGNNYGMQVGRNGTSPGATLLATEAVGDHNHSISSQTSTVESSHTHTVGDHTHSISAHTHTINGSTSSTVTNHTHSMTYGIYEGPAASTPGFHLIINSTDVTVDLGGPWNSDFEVDITPYLTDANGLLLRQKNNVEISTGQLCDLEVTVRSLMSAMAVVPV